MPASVQEEVACIIGKDYPKPIVDHSEAYKFARKSIGEVRRKDTSKDEAKKIVKKHGSRKRPSNNRTKVKTADNESKSRQRKRLKKKATSPKDGLVQSNLSNFLKIVREDA